MVDILDGLYTYEIILLIAGSFLLTILFSGLIVMLAKEEKVSRFYILSFIIPLVLLAIPMNQLDKIKRGFYDLEAYSKAILYKFNGSNSMALRVDEAKIPEYIVNLKDLLQDFTKRPINSSDRLSKMSEAFLALENDEMAIQLANAALKKNPNNYKAFNVKRSIGDDLKNLGIK